MTVPLTLDVINVLRLSFGVGVVFGVALGIMAMVLVEYWSGNP
ncbi:MAG TPA: hypothetical protein VNT30_09280 [Stellaceae bacterium]|nr:hypothetical protein [Stellaceae bacterium]